MNPNQQLPPVSLPSFQLCDLPLLKYGIRARIFGSTILGSQLGGLISKAATDIGKTLALKDFGGLKQFAVTYLPDVVTLGGQYGNSADLIYQINQENVTAESIAGLQAAVRPARVPVADAERNQFWQAFSNPSSHLIIEFDADRSLFIRPRNISVSTEGFEAFPSISPNEYSNIIKLFAKDQLSSEQQLLANEVISQQAEETLHFAWHRFLLDKCGLSISHLWGQVRVKRLVSLFEIKARELLFPEDIISTYSELLSKSQRRQRQFHEQPKTTPSQFDSPKEELAKSSHISSLIANSVRRGSLQALAMHVVGRMTDEEIRQLVLPVGYVLDAIDQLPAR